MAVKTGSIALQKDYFLFFFFLSWLGQKSMFFGVKFIFPDSSQKANATLPFFKFIFSLVLE